MLSWQRQQRHCFSNATMTFRDRISRGILLGWIHTEGCVETILMECISAVNMVWLGGRKKTGYSKMLLFPHPQWRRGFNNVPLCDSSIANRPVYCQQHKQQPCNAWKACPPVLQQKCLHRYFPSDQQLIKMWCLLSPTYYGVIVATTKFILNDLCYATFQQSECDCKTWRASKQL